MNNWIIGRRWNVVQTAPNSEALAATSAAEMGFEVFYPRYREKRVQSHRKPVERQLAYLPGYIFTADNRYSQDGRPLSLWELGKAKGVAAVLRVGSEYAAVPDTDPVMQALLKMADDWGFVTREIAKKPITLFKEGEKVIVNDGPFRDFPGVVKEISKSRKIAQVWLQIFGRETKIELEIGQLRHPVKLVNRSTKAA